MKKVLLFLLPVFTSAILFAQNCSCYPNTPDLVWNNRVRKQTIILEDQNAGMKYVSQVLFFDTSGNCNKRVYVNFYNNRRTYQFNAWSDPQDVKVRWNTFGYYDKDSNEIISNRLTYYYDDAGRTWKEENYYRQDSTYITNVTLYRQDSSGRSMPFMTCRLNQPGDTTEKSFTVQNGNVTTYTVFAKKKKRWIEKERNVNERNEDGFPVRSERYEYGKLLENRTWKYRYDSGRLAETSEYNDGELVNKTSYFSGGYTFTTYDHGKVVNTYTENYPIADPIPDGPYGFPPEDPPADTGKGTQWQEPPAPPQRKKPVMEPRTEKIYRSNNPANELMMVQEFGSDGLVVKQEVLWDHKIYYWTYEYYGQQ